MFAGLSLAISEVFVGTSSMVIKVGIDGHIADPMNFLAVYKCAAFPGVTAPHPIDIDAGNHILGHTDAPVDEHTINADYYSSMLNAGAAYTVKCCTVSPPFGAPIPDDEHICNELAVTMDGGMQPTCTTGLSVDDTPVAAVSFGESIDLGHTKYFDFPSSMAGMSMYPLPRVASAGSKLTFTCCAGEECVFAVSLYRCTACTGPKPHGVNQQLLLDNWGSSSCSPKFDDDFKTTSFFKEMGNAHETISFTLNHDEVVQVFGRTGALTAPFCKAPTQHGPFPAGPNCGDNCPANI